MTEVNDDRQATLLRVWNSHMRPCNEAVNLSFTIERRIMSVTKFGIQSGLDCRPVDVEQERTYEGERMTLCGDDSTSTIENS